MGMHNYDPAKVASIFANVPLIGTADGTFVKVARNSDAFSLVVGADGEAARAKSNDKSGTITITVLQTSQANDILSARHALDSLTMQGSGAFFLKDALGTTLVSAQNCWVKKFAEIEFGKEIVAREWTLESDNLEIFVGGSVF